MGGGWHQAETLPVNEISQTAQEHVEIQPCAAPKKLSKPSVSWHGRTMPHLLQLAL